MVSFTQAKKILLPASILVPAMLTPVMSSCDKGGANEKPNVILIITDDQGFGDIGFNGNPWIKTPNIDQLAKESVRLANFHVGTTCAPTRAGLMTGLHNNRERVWHTIMGRSLLKKDDLTLANVFENNGYATGMFGKWHLGDNYPYRPHDRGFNEAFYHGSGGVTQITDYWGNDYFDDTYYRNGLPEKTKGYCTDVWYENAIQFIEKNQNQPFFCYLATNAPHAPFHCPQEYIDMYKDMPDVINPEFYGMITNFDDNLGKLRKKLEEMKIADNTILIYLTDNGTAAGAELSKDGFVTSGYNAGMRGKKGSQYNGGHRVPFYIYWKNGKITGGKDVNRLSSFMDIMPTLIELCGLQDPGINFDGMSIKPLLYGKEKKWPERIIITDTQRDDYPVKWKNCAIMNDSFHLVDGTELYNIVTDPGQQKDIAAEHPQLVEKLRQSYEKWWNDLAPGFEEFSEIIIHPEKENPTRLTSHDTHTGTALPAWNQYQVRNGFTANGYWIISIEQPGKYNFSLRRYPVESGAGLNASVPKTDPVPGGEGYPEGRNMNIVKAKISVGPLEQEMAVPRDAGEANFTIELPAGIQKLQTWFTDKSGKEFGAYYVYVSKAD